MIKEIPGLGGYKASDGDDGNIYSKSGKVLTTIQDSHGYACVRINHRLVKKHQLLAITFIPNPDNLPIINHKDGNKMHSYVNNLEWCTHSYNTKHAFEHGLISVDIEHMREIAKLSSGGKQTAKLHSVPILQLDYNGNTINRFSGIREASRVTGIQSSGITRCCKGEYKKYKGYVWRYEHE